ncbi:MAG: hypothetical protein JSS43_13680 [Proteobacteria bacterium]|nr:hypothetical protein [Pseudomonadota bacterium]
MNRLLTLTTGGLFAAMAIVPVAAFAAGSATSGTETKPHAAMTAPAPADSKVVTPSTEAKGDMKGHKVETKTEAKGDAVKHDGAVKAPAGQSSVQPKPVEPGKS